MSRLTRTILRTRRREVLNRALHGGAMGLWIACAAGLVLLAIDRYFVLNLPHVGYLVLALGGLTIGVIRAFFTHPDLFATAVRIDRAMQLKDRVATACVLAVHGTKQRSDEATEGYAQLRTSPVMDPAFAEIVRRDADNLAGRLDIRTLAPLRFTRAWAGVIALAPLLALGVLFLPAASPADAKDPTPTVDPAVAEEAERERERVRESIEESIRTLRDEADPDDPRVQQELDALERLAEQLADPERFQPDDVERVRDESAARMSELAERLEARSRREGMADEQLLERFAGLEAPEPPMSAEEFDRALRRGDFGTAAEELQRQLDNRENLAPEERRDYAEHLRELNEQLERATREAQQQQAEQRAQLEQHLQDHGIDDETAQEMLDDESLTQSEIEQMLREQGLDEELVQRMSRDLERIRDQDMVDKLLEEDTDSIREALEQAMREFESDEPFDPFADEDLFYPDMPDAADPADPFDEPFDEQDEPEVDPAEKQPETDPTDDVDREGEPERPDESERDDERQDREDAEREDDERPEDVKEEEDEETRAAEERDDEETERKEDDEREEDEERVKEAEVDDREQQEQEQKAAERDPDPDPDPDQVEGDQPVAGHDREQPAPDPDAEPDPGTGDEAPSLGDDEIEGDAAEQSQDMAEPDVGEQSPSDRLRQFEERRQQSEQRRQQSEDLRERVRRMLDEEQPEPGQPPDPEQDLADRLQEQLAGADMGGDEAGVGDEPIPHDTVDPVALDDDDRRYMTEDVDLRDDDVVGDLLAEWLSDEPREGETGRTQRELTDEQIRRVREIAERSVEDAAVPSRYHERIRRFFGRLGETIEEE